MNTIQIPHKYKYKYHTKTNIIHICIVILHMWTFNSWCVALCKVHVNMKHCENAVLAFLFAKYWNTQYNPCSAGCPTPLPPACVLPSLYPVFAAYIFTSFCICVFCICICVFVLVYLPGHCPLPIRYPLPPSLRTFSPIFYPLSSASPPKDQLRSDILRIYKISPHWTGSPWLKKPSKSKTFYLFLWLKDPSLLPWHLSKRLICISKCWVCKNPPRVSRKHLNINWHIEQSQISNNLK